jgi:hypothetical protein
MRPAPTNPAFGEGKPASRGRLRPSRRIRLAVAAIAAVLLLTPLVAPLPRLLLPVVAAAAPDWMLGSRGGSGFVEAGRKLVRLELQSSLAAHLAERPIPPDLPDAQRIARRLRAVKAAMIDQTELPHRPVNGPVVAGLAYCDSLNGFAATLLSHEYDEAGIVAVDDPVTGTRHSFGRVRSRGRDWLYFDIWGDQVAVFRSHPGRGAEYLVRLRGVVRTPPPGVMAMVGRVHDRAHAGLAHNRLQPTVGGYLIHRLANWLRHGDASGPGVREGLAAKGLGGPIPAGTSAPYWASWGSPPPTRPPAAIDAWLSARLSHLAGDLGGARRGYAEVAREEGPGSVYGRAARIFLERLARDPG